MISETEKPKIPSKFAKRTARYNEFCYKIDNKKYKVSLLLCKFMLKVVKPRF